MLYNIYPTNSGSLILTHYQTSTYEYHSPKSNLPSRQRRDSTILHFAFSLFTFHFFLFTYLDLQPFWLALYICRENSTNRPLFMQNEPNFHRGKNEPNPISKKGLRTFYTPSDNEKQPKTNPIQTQFPLPQTSPLAHFPKACPRPDQGAQTAAPPFRNQTRNTLSATRYTLHKPHRAPKVRRLLTTLLTNRMVRKMAIISAMSKAPARAG